MKNTRPPTSRLENSRSEIDMREIKFRAWDGEYNKMHKISGISWRDITGFGEPERYARDSIQDLDFAESDKVCWVSPYFFTDGLNYEEGLKVMEAELKEHEERLQKIILMQYTGLKDKNGKEIYEGDVVEYQYLNTLEQEVRKAEVKLLSIGDVNRNITAYYPFCYSISGSYKERDREITECYLTPANDCEVIGNIYENPELLK
jgi:uncharacterized phage protein (TIGR01671 family)